MKAVVFIPRGIGVVNDFDIDRILSTFYRMAEQAALDVADAWR